LLYEALVKVLVEVVARECTFLVVVAANHDGEEFCGPTPGPLQQPSWGLFNFSNFWKESCTSS
jgi:hypothetical protein